MPPEPSPAQQQQQQGLLTRALDKGTRTSKGPSSGTNTSLPAATSLAPVPRRSVLSSSTSSSPTPTSFGPSGARHAVVAATLTNAELTAAKASSELYYDRYTAIDEENTKLRSDLEQQEGDALVVIRRLETQLVAAFEEANAFRQGVAERLARQAEAEKEVVAHYEELLGERDRTIAEFAALITRLQNDLRQASRYVQQRQEHQQELQELHQTIEEMVMAHEKEMAALRFQNVDRKMKLVALERTMRDEFQNMVDQESRRVLEAKHAALLRQNSALGRDKEGLVRDMDELLTLTAKINAERTGMKRVSELHKSAHEEVLRYTAVRNRQGRETELKVQRLEARVRELLAEQSATKSELRAAYEGKLAELSAQLAEAENARAVMQKELASMRKLATKVVGQRTDLETFFYTALEDCKRYKVAASAPTAATPATSRVAATNRREGRTANGAHDGATLAVRRPVVPRTAAPRVAGAAVRLGSPTPDTNRIAGCAVGADDTFRLTQPTLLEAVGGDATRAQGNGAATSSPSLLPDHETTPHPCSVSLPPVKAPVSAEAAATPLPTSLPASGARLEELDWADKERVIKALFYFINSSYYSTPSATAAPAGAAA